MNFLVKRVFIIFFTGFVPFVRTWRVPFFGWKIKNKDKKNEIIPWWIWGEKKSLSRSFNSISFVFIFTLPFLVNQNDNKCGINTQKDTKKEKDKLKRDRSLPEILMRPQWPQRAFIARPKKATNFDTKFYSKSQWNVIFRDAAVSTLCHFYKKLTAKWTKLIEKYWNDVIAPVE